MNEFNLARRLDEGNRIGMVRSGDVERKRYYTGLDDGARRVACCSADTSCLATPVRQRIDGMSIWSYLPTITQSISGKSWVS